jgi:hypothetical protein
LNREDILKIKVTKRVSFKNVKKVRFHEIMTKCIFKRHDIHRSYTHQNSKYP